MSSRSVFVGNLPYDVSEEMLGGLFSEVGPVVSIRLVYDQDTGKSKGFGFCEYADAATALSAIRNLNGREFNGRTVRVDAADEKNNDGPQKRPSEEEAPPNDLAPEPPAKKRRLDAFLRDLQQVELTFSDIALLSSPIREALIQLAQVLNAEKPKE